MSWETDIESDLDWRLAELAALKIQAAGSPAKSILQSALLRALIAMLYAHYEGYCKNAIRIYLREIKALGVQRIDCKERLGVFSLQKAFREAKSYSTDQCWRFYQDNLDKLLHEVVDYEIDQHGEIALVGESNLKPADLRANFDFACLPQTEVDNHEQLLKGLVGRRNGIAHGKKLLVNDLADYEEYERAATAAMYDIAYSIIDALTDKQYLKHVAYYG
jgi:hypothetical protein